MKAPFELLVDSVFVIQSLRAGDATTGENVHANAIAPFGRRSRTRVERSVRRVASRRELFTNLAEIAAIVGQEGLAPFLQIDCHGAAVGWEIGGELVTWDELVPALCAINAASRMNLFVLAASCSGAHLFKALTTAYEDGRDEISWGRAPIRACWGHAESVTAERLADSLSEFYRCLLGNQDSATAMDALSDGDLVTAERIYARVEQEIVRTDRIEQTVERMHETFGTPRQVARARYQAHLDVARERYFWLDLFPENEDRFARFVGARNTEGANAGLASQPEP